MEWRSTPMSLMSRSCFTIQWLDQILLRCPGLLLRNLWRITPGYMSSLLWMMGLLSSFWMVTLFLEEWRASKERASLMVSYFIRDLLNIAQWHMSDCWAYHVHNPVCYIQHVCSSSMFSHDLFVCNSILVVASKHGLFASLLVVSCCFGKLPDYIYWYWLGNQKDLQALVSFPWGDTSSCAPIHTDFSATLFVTGKAQLFI